MRLDISVLNVPNTGTDRQPWLKYTENTKHEDAFAVVTCPQQTD